MKLSQWSQVHQRRVAVGRLQSQGKIHRNRSGAAAAFRVHYGKDLAAGPFPVDLPLRRSETNKRFQKVGSGGGPLDKLTSPGPHGAHNHLRLRNAADGEQRHPGQFLVEQFDRPQSQNRIIRGDVDQNHVRICALDPVHNRIGGGQRKTGVSVHCPSHTGAVHQNL
jgi:hypothetical protein